MRCNGSMPPCVSCSTCERSPARARPGTARGAVAYARQARRRCRRVCRLGAEGRPEDLGPDQRRGERARPLSAGGIPSIPPLSAQPWPPEDEARRCAKPSRVGDRGARRRMRPKRPRAPRTSDGQTGPMSRRGDDVSAGQPPSLQRWSLCGRPSGEVPALLVLFPTTPSRTGRDRL
jgi:hypothetical protein